MENKFEESNKNMKRIDKKLEESNSILNKGIINLKNRKRNYERS